MVKTVEETARKQDVVLLRKDEKLCDGLIRRYRPNILLQNAFLLKTTEWSVQWQIFGLRLTVNPGASMLAKKRLNYLMQWLFVVLHCEAVTFPLKQFIKD